MQGFVQEVQPHSDLNVSRAVGLAEDFSEILQIKEGGVRILETNPIRYVDGVNPNLQTGAFAKPQLGSLCQRKIFTIGSKSVEIGEVSI